MSLYFNMYILKLFIFKKLFIITYFYKWFVCEKFKVMEKCYKKV